MSKQGWWDSTVIVAVSSVLPGVIETALRQGGLGPLGIGIIVWLDVNGGGPVVDNAEAREYTECSFCVWDGGSEMLRLGARLGIARDW